MHLRVTRLRKARRRLEIRSNRGYAGLSSTSRRAGDRTGSGKRACDDEARRAALHRPRELAPAVHVLRAERIFVAHEHEAPRYIGRAALEVLRRATAEIADLRADARRRRRLRAEQRIARERGAAGKRERCFLQAPAGITDWLDGDARPNGGKALSRERQRTLFARRAGAPPAAVAEREEIGP